MNKLLALLGLPAVMASTYSIDGGKTTYFRQINHQVYGPPGSCQWRGPVFAVCPM